MTTPAKTTLILYMKLLAIADRPPKNGILQTIQENPDIDLVVTLGDLDQFCLQELEQIQHIPKLGVYGNHCSGQYLETLGIWNMHLQIYSYKGVTFGGFQGCVRYKQSPTAIMCTQQEASLMLTNFPKVDVILCHCPPFGVNDDQSDLSHTGFIGLKDYVLKHQPKYLLHGHTYPTIPQTKLDQTNIMYVYSDQIVELL